MGGTGAGPGATRFVTSGLTRVGGARACAEVAPALTSGRAFSVDKWAGLERGACAFGLGSSPPRNQLPAVSPLPCLSLALERQFRVKMGTFYISLSPHALSLSGS